MGGPIQNLFLENVVERRRPRLRLGCLALLPVKHTSCLVFLKFEDRTDERS
jgi:hypothetical protein